MRRQPHSAVLLKTVVARPVEDEDVGVGAVVLHRVDGVLGAVPGVEVPAALGETEPSSCIRYHCQASSPDSYSRKAACLISSSPAAAT